MAREDGAADTERAAPKLAGRVEVWLVARGARVRATPADRFLRTLSTSTNYNRLWCYRISGWINGRPVIRTERGALVGRRRSI